MVKDHTFALFNFWTLPLVNLNMSNLIFYLKVQNGPAAVGSITIRTLYGYVMNTGNIKKTVRLRTAITNS